MTASSDPGGTVPIFEYRCCTCGELFELLVLGTREPRCVRCGGDDLEKRVSTFAFRAASGDRTGSAGSRCSTCSASSCSGCR